MRKLTLFLLFIVYVLCLDGQQNIPLDGVWKAQQASKVFVDGSVLTNSSKDITTSWLDAKVPGTVLSVLWDNGIVENPYLGLNNKNITDMFVSGRQYYTYWFYRDFTIPTINIKDNVWLNFRGINYLADVFLNGHRVNVETHEGMFLREKYNITPYLNKNGTNKLAVLVQPVIFPGNASMGQAGDGEIARNVARQFVAGWDWICNVPDRNTGIWDKVSLEITGSVDLQNGYVWSSVPEKRVPKGFQEPAYIYPSIEVSNPTNETQQFVLTFTYQKGKKIDTVIELLPYQHKEVKMRKVKVLQPKLWWSNGVGEQNLYQAIFTAKINNKVVDREQFMFGIRETKSYYDTNVGARIFTLNGQKVFIKGGNWIGSDALMRLSEERYETEVRFHAEANINMIRVWGGSMTERPEFYEACDKYGIMVWQDFWISGDGNGEWYDPIKKQSQERRKQYPDNHHLFIETAIDQVKMLRNHPSLYLWCGGNETRPPEDINRRLKNEVLPQYDHTRDYLQKSTGDEISVNEVTQNGDGPYGWQNPLFFFETDWLPFNPEIGSMGLPNLENLKRILQTDNLQPPVKTEQEKKPSRPAYEWQYHKILPVGEGIYGYGKIEGLEDFVKTFQVVSYQQYQALQEGFTSRMWDFYTGIIIWKTQNPWTALRGMFYDYYLDPVGGMYGYKHAADPLHGQYNLNDKSISLVNQTLEEQQVALKVMGYDLHGKQLKKVDKDVIIPPNTVKRIIDAPVKDTQVTFLRIIAKDNDGILHKNFYWIGSGSGIDHQNLENLESTQLRMVSLKTKEAGEYKVSVSNIGSETAFFIRIKLIDKRTNELLLPVFYTENYFTLFSKESEEIIIDAHKLSKELLPYAIVVAEAWNHASTKTMLLP